MPKQKRISAKAKARKQMLYRERAKAEHQAQLNGNLRDSATAASLLASPNEEIPSAFMGQAPPCGENVPGRLEVGLSKRENASECPVVPAAPPLGSRLSERTRFMSLNPESSQGDCTTSSTATAGVPSLKNGVAGQAQTGDEVPLEAFKGSPSISSFTKGTRSHNNEANNKCAMKTEQTRTNQMQITKNFLQGNFHQADEMFGENSGRQCVPNCLAAAALNSRKTVNEWVTTDIDTILVTGNELYSYMQASTSLQHNYILINELPRELDVFDSTFSFSFEESFATMVGNRCENINWQEFNACPLFESLQRSLLQCDACFICFNGNTILVGKRNGFFFIFDSHSRSQKGFVHANGKSICILLNEIEAVYSHIQQLANSMGIFSSMECEVTGVSIYSQDNKKENSEECDDLYLVSETTAHPEFQPFTVDVQRKVSTNLGIPFIERNSNIVECKKAGKPNICHVVSGDGNCFFRAISYAVSNTESNHAQVRQVVCNYALQHEEFLQGVLRQPSESIESYIKTSRMKEDGIWATEFEVVCTAFMLNCDIYVYSQGKWLKYSASQWKHGIQVMPYAIYLDHKQECHYNVVLSTLHQSGCPCTMRNLTTDYFESSHKNASGYSMEAKRETSLSSPSTGMTENSEHRKRYETRYNTDPEYRAKKQAKSRAYQRKRYANDDPFKEKKISQVKEMYKKDSSYRGNRKHSVKQKYHFDEQYKEKVKENSARKYKTNKQFREKLIMQSKQKYTTNKQFRDKLIMHIKQKYKTNKQFREKLIIQSKQKYMTNKQFRERLKSEMRQKNNRNYKTNKQFREWVKAKIKQKNKQKYMTNELFRENVKMKNKQKYNTNEKYREKVKQCTKEYSMLKYRTDCNKKQTIITKSKENYKKKIGGSPEMKKIYAKGKLCSRQRQKAQNVGIVNVNSFIRKASEGPVYACACCHRLCFSNQVQKCHEALYRKKGIVIAQNAKKCISKKYLHECTKKCSNSCVRSNLWICKTCHKKLLKNDLPAESMNNELELEDIPEELKVLNKLERNLVALHIPFMKVVSLPKGGQRAIHGPVVCVPSNIDKATRLPRGEESDLILKVKLKRKLCYKGHYQYQFVNANNVHTAVNYLKRRNRWYSDVETSSRTCSTVENEIEKGTERTSQCHMDNQVKEKCENVTSKVNARKSVSTKDEHDAHQINCQDKDESEQNVEDYGVQYDTCLQPADIGQEVLDHYFDEIYNLAPAEGMNPVKLLQEKGNEGKSFPVLFPSGKNTFDETRHLQLSLSRYFNTRLMNADNRFAEDTDYIFYCQYLSELKQVIDKTQISLRKSKKTADCGNDKNSSRAVRTSSELKKLIQKDEALRFLQPIRGTPSYWQGAQKDLFAMLRQLGIPTWFCSFSAAEFRWKDIITTILKQ